MSNVQVRDVPEPVVETLKNAASAHGQSLQQYLLDVLTEQARADTTSAIMAEAAADVRDNAVQPFDAAELVRQARDERDSDLLDRYGE